MLPLTPSAFANPSQPKWGGQRDWLRAELALVSRGEINAARCPFSVRGAHRVELRDAVSRPEAGACEVFCFV
jgi:hypothetical protein